MRLYRFMFVRSIIGFIFWKVLFEHVIDPIIMRRKKPVGSFLLRIRTLRKVHFLISFGIVRYLLGISAIISKRTILFDSPLANLLIGGIPEISDQCCIFLTKTPPYLMDVDRINECFNFAYYVISGYHTATESRIVDVLLAILVFCLGCILTSIVTDLYAFIYSPCVFVIVGYVCFLFAKWKGQSKNDGEIWPGFTLIPRKIHVDNHNNPYTGITAVPGDSFDDYVSISEVIKKRPIDYVKEYSKRYGEFHCVERDQFVQYPEEAIDSIIKALKKYARRRNISAAFHKANLFDKSYPGIIFVIKGFFSKIKCVFLYIWKFLQWIFSGILFVLKKLFSKSAFLLYVFVFIEYKLFTWIQVTHGFAIFPFIFLLFPTIANLVDVIKFIIEDMEYLDSPPKLYDFIDDMKIKTKRAKGIDGKKRDGNLKQMVKRYHSFREEDNFNISERLSELLILKWISNPNKNLRIYATSKLNMFLIEEIRPIRNRLILITPSCVEEDFSDEKEGKTRKYYKIDLLNHIKTVE